jgi:hypothetical protein
MPDGVGLTDQQLNFYEQNLARQQEQAAQARFGGLGNAQPNYGTSSMTNSVNKFNSARTQAFLDALAKREELAQSWQHTANQRALTAGQIANTENENTRGLHNISYQQKQLAQADLHHRENLENSYNIALMNNRRKREDQQLEREKFDEGKREAAAQMVLRKQLALLHSMYQRHQITENQWINRVNASYKKMGLQFRLNDLRRAAADKLVKRPTTDAEMMDLLARYTSSETASQRAEQRIRDERASGEKAEEIRHEEMKKFIDGLGIENKNALIHEAQNGILALTANFGW